MKEFEFDIGIIEEDDQGALVVGRKIILNENTLRQLKEALDEVDD